MPVKELPTGTVTFMFTDIEGSTRLLKELGEGFGELLDHHHTTLRDVISKHRGIEVSTEGDSFFIVFPSVPNAINAAADAQRCFADTGKMGRTELRVRMGLHTGEAELVADSYGGLDVHRAARISSAAHGGQVLLSAITAHHASESSRVGPGVHLLDLGSFRLKDLDVPEQLFQLRIEGLRADFPPPRAMGRPVQIPARLDEFVVRDREVSEIRALVDSSRLVTLTGPGGIGKTSLATEVARMATAGFPDGVYFVGLGAVVDSELVASTIAQELSLREEGGRPIVRTVEDYLEGKRVLLLLDNFEQIVQSAPLISRLLGVAPGLKVLVTSRAPLRISGEREYPVPPMNMPDPGRVITVEDLEDYEAIKLFVQRARSFQPDFVLTDENASVISEICVRLDGLPLAIELAAARVRLLSPQEIKVRLDRSLSILSGAARDVPQRQRTLTDAIDWSYRLLDESHRALFRLLSVFRRGWTLEAAEAVCDAEAELGLDVIDGLDSLVDNSLVRTTQPDGRSTRFAMLETIREFALHALADSGELDKVRRRHAEHFTAMARAAVPEILNEERDWPELLDAEHDNMRAVLRFRIESRKLVEGLALGTSLWRFWQIRSHLAEGRMWLTEMLGLPESEQEPAVRAAALIALGSLTYWQNDFSATRAAWEEARETFERIDDRGGIAEALYNLGFLELIEGDTRRARQLHEKSVALYEESGDELRIAFAHWGIAMTHIRDRNLDEARRLGLESLHTFERHHNWFGRALSDFVMIQVERHSGNYEAARQLIIDGLDRPDVVKDVSSLSSMVELQADIEIAMNRPRRGLKLGAAGRKLRVDYGGGAPPPLLDLRDPKELVSDRLSQSEIELIWDEGMQLSVDEIIAYARKDPTGDE
jgi:predicted ATPase/class 3 adenylate cyclase